MSIVSCPCRFSAIKANFSRLTERRGGIPVLFATITLPFRLHNKVRRHYLNVKLIENILNIAVQFVARDGQ